MVTEFSLRAQVSLVYTAMPEDRTSHPIGYVRADPASRTLFFYLLPYNFPVLLPLIGMPAGDRLMKTNSYIQYSALLVLRAIEYTVFILFFSRHVVLVYC